MAAAPVQWSSRFGFLLAAVGFAVGLGNIWRFPYVTGENGGGAFVIVYLLCAVAIGVPFLIAELLLGRRGRGSPPVAMANVANAEGATPAWRVVGGLHLATAFAISVVYAVVAGWVLAYLVQSLTGGFTEATSRVATSNFDALTGSVTRMFAYSTAVLLICCTIIYVGVQKGIERTVQVLMPTMFVLLVALALWNVISGGFAEALNYLFAPDFSKIDGSVLLAAVGQAFFSIGVGMAGMMIFGSYLPQDVSIARSAILIVIADTAVALTAGLVIFPAVFHYGLDAAGGPGLIFQTLPVAFAQMPGGAVVGALFFFLLTVAAVTSLVGLVEPQVAWLAHKLDCSRAKATVTVGSIVAGCAVVSVLSYNVWADVKILGSPLSTVLDFVPNQIMLPLGGLLIAVFVGWVMSRASCRDELNVREPIFAAWHVLLRYAGIGAVAVVFVVGLT